MMTTLGTAAREEKTVDKNRKGAEHGMKKTTMFIAMLILLAALLAMCWQQHKRSQEPQRQTYYDEVNDPNFSGYIEIQKESEDLVA